MVGVRVGWDMAELNNEHHQIEDCKFENLSVAGVAIATRTSQAKQNSFRYCSFVGQKAVDIPTVEGLFSGASPKANAPKPTWPALRPPTPACEFAVVEDEPTTAVSRYLRAGIGFDPRRAVDLAWWLLQRGGSTDKDSARQKLTEALLVTAGDAVTVDSVLEELGGASAPVSTRDLIPLRPTGIHLDAGSLVVDTCRFNGVTSAVTAREIDAGGVQIRSVDFEGSEHLFSVDSASSATVLIQGGRISTGLVSYNGPDGTWQERVGQLWRNPGWIARVTGPKTVTFDSVKFVETDNQLDETGHFLGYLEVRGSPIAHRPATASLTVRSCVLPFLAEPELEAASATFVVRKTVPRGELDNVCTHAEPAREFARWRQEWTASHNNEDPVSKRRCPLAEDRG